MTKKKREEFGKSVIINGSSARAYFGDDTAAFQRKTTANIHVGTTIEGTTLLLNTFQKNMRHIRIQFTEINNEFHGDYLSF